MHPEALVPETEEALKELRRSSVLSAFYLGGGTGLALHFGHRRSADLDLFSETSFDAEALLQRVQLLPGFSLTSKDADTLHAQVIGSRV